jgi:hypothetical protein
MTLNLDVFEGVGGPTYEKYKDFLVDEMKACPNGVAKKWREDFRNELYNPIRQTLPPCFSRAALLRSGVPPSLSPSKSPR